MNLCRKLRESEFWAVNYDTTVSLTVLHFFCKRSSYIYSSWYKHLPKINSQILEGSQMNPVKNVFTFLVSGQKKVAVI